MRPTRRWRGVVRRHRLDTDLHRRQIAERDRLTRLVGSCDADLALAGIVAANTHDGCRARGAVESAERATPDREQLRAAVGRVDRFALQPLRGRLAVYRKQDLTGPETGLALPETRASPE